MKGLTALSCKGHDINIKYLNTNDDRDNTVKKDDLLLWREIVVDIMLSFEATCSCCTKYRTRIICREIIHMKTLPFLSQSRYFIFYLL